MPLRSSSLLLLALLAGCAQPVPRTTPATPAPGPVDGPEIAFRCGDTTVQTRFGQDAMTLTLDGRTLTLTQAISASGARYAGLGPDGPVEFWNKGREATLTVGPRAYPDCQEVPGGRG